ncbi:SGNH/GDSL hydrolase family protein [Georgenia faecalis]|uniref:SGNH/GDSL hydrolase family protein n=1 Tax=Georgenia faecalis TaxID=2483799 RepID=UPI000FDC0D12|nr:SGNH/GDSL hydrolase family protein [Georgenia faecalis]
MTPGPRGAAHRCELSSDVFRGAVSVEPGEGGLVPARLPGWARARVDDPFMRMTSAQAAGVRLAVRTAASVIEVDYRGARMVASEDAAIPPSRWEVTVGSVCVGGADAVATGRAVFAFDQPERARTLTGPATTVRIDVGGGGVERDLEVWVPYTDAVEVVAVRADRPIRAAGPRAAPRWVHYGSSISHGYTADSTVGTWPVIAARRAGVQLTSLAFSGSAMLDGFIARVIRDLPAEVISVKAGINIVSADAMRRRTFAPALHAFLDTIRDGHPRTPIVVASPIWCEPVEERAGPTYEDPDLPYPWQRTRGTAEDVRQGKLSLRVVREETARVVAARGDDALVAVDGLTLYSGRDAERMPLPDNLHPGPDVHALIGERWSSQVLEPVLQEYALHRE